jgi:hypothetical protein
VRNGNLSVRSAGRTHLRISKLNLKRPSRAHLIPSIDQIQDLKQLWDRMEDGEDNSLSVDGALSFLIGGLTRQVEGDEPPFVATSVSITSGHRTRRRQFPGIIDIRAGRMWSDADGFVETVAAR